MEKGRKDRRAPTRVLKLLTVVVVFPLTLLAFVPLPQAAVLVVAPATGETMAAGVAEKAQTAAGVTKVERYLLVRTQPHDVIGVEAGAPLRIVTRDEKIIEARVEAGKAFRNEDEGKNVALVGKRVYAEDYGYRGGMGAMATMKHLLEIGQTFKFTEAGPRIRVLGTFTVSLDVEATKVVLPLTTAQKLFSREGKVSHLFLTVEGDPDGAAKVLQAALGEGTKVRVASR